VTHNQIWPDVLYIVRHGESAGNVARDAALLAGRLAMPNDVKDIRPDLVVGHGLKSIKERTRARAPATG